jgi:hypothetical protein
MNTFGSYEEVWMVGQKKRIEVGMDRGSKSSEISSTGNGGMFKDAFICIPVLWSGLEGSAPTSL